MKKNGFTLLIALLVASILLTIGLSIFNLSTKELELTTTAKDSQTALYAADSGIECGLYWDTKKGHLAFPGDPSDPLTGSTTPIMCNNQLIPLGPSSVLMSGDDSQATTTFTFNVSASSSVTVSVEKVLSGGGLHSYMEADGYNTSDVNDPDRLERTLTEQY